MEELFKVIKDFLLNQFNEILLEYEDEKTKLPKLTEKQIVFGNIDPMKNTQDVVVSILPETQETGEGTVSDEVTESVFTITFVCRNALYDILIKRMCRYASAFKRIVTENYSLNNCVDNSEIGTVKFYSDVGIVDNTMTASEFILNIYTSEEY